MRRTGLLVASHCLRAVGAPAALAPAACVATTQQALRLNNAGGSSSTAAPSSAAAFRAPPLSFALRGFSAQPLPLSDDEREERRQEPKRPAAATAAAAASPSSSSSSAHAAARPTDAASSSSSFSAAAAAAPKDFERGDIVPHMGLHKEIAEYAFAPSGYPEGYVETVSPRHTAPQQVRRAAPTTAEQAG